MRWSAVLRAVCVAAAMVACGGHALASDTDDDDDDATPSRKTALTNKKSLVKKDWLKWLKIPDLIGSDRPAFDWLTGGMPDQLLYFSGFDIWRRGFGGYIGMQWTPTEIDRQGFILRLSMADGFDRFIAGRHVYDTATSRFTLQPGYKFKGNGIEVQMLAGVELETDLLVRNGRPWRLRGEIGARITTDLWWEPTRWMMLQYAYSLTTVRNGASMRAASGWRLFDRFWVGPELSMSGDREGHQYRIGAHVSGLRTDEVEWSVAAGYQQDDFGRDGIYGRMGLVVRPKRQPFFE